MIGENAAKAEAMARVEANADPNWMAWALQAVYIVAWRGMSFTADEVWKQLSVWKPSSTTHEPRAMGPVLRDAARRGWIIPTGAYVNSRRRSRNSGPMMLWAPTKQVMNAPSRPTIEEES